MTKENPLFGIKAQADCGMKPGSIEMAALSSRTLRPVSLSNNTVQLEQIFGIVFVLVHVPSQS